MYLPGPGDLENHPKAHLDGHQPSGRPCSSRAQARPPLLRSLVSLNRPLTLPWTEAAAEGWAKEGERGTAAYGTRGGCVQAHAGRRDLEGGGEKIEGPR